MEKRDIIVIVVAIFIVLIMAMYIKPLVTGKEAKLIPDEISNLFKKDNLSNISDDDKDHLVKSEEHIYSKPAIISISPNDTKPNSTSIIEIEGKNFKESMEIMVFSDSHNQTFNTTFEKNKLIGKNVVLSEGDWIVKIYDPELNITYNTQHVIHAIPTHESTDINSNLIKEESLSPIPTPLRTSIYTIPIKETNETKLIIFKEIEGSNSKVIGPVYIPTGYWDLRYTINFQTNLATPKTDNIFEFNKQYKEALISYEVGPNNKNITVIYDKDGRAIGMESDRSENKSDIEFIRSSDKIIIKKPKEGDWEAGLDELPFDITEGTASGSLVESVSYGVPDITITVKDLDYKKRDITIKPDGGIDPLQWN
ncbi:MAG: hypothetical protein GXY48_05950 [Methanomicrobiales archaeon]|nr:hypothetical protein [Methanomicrobiales archaeon]